MDRWPLAPPVPLQRVFLLRHGETEGNSSVRFYGATDVPLSHEGRLQMRRARRSLPVDGISLVVASPLHRAWESAVIVAPGRSVRLEGDFREIDFGRWEGLTREEIEEREPELAGAWLEGREGFEFPEGEPRADFRARVCRGAERLLSSGVHSVVVAAHKGVIRTIAHHLTGTNPPEEALGLAAVLELTRHPNQTWHLKSPSTTE